MIMGRRTFESLPGLLPGRANRDHPQCRWSAPGAERALSVRTRRWSWAEAQRVDHRRRGDIRLVRAARKAWS
jgi:dihydrofolate reductase